MGYKSIVGLALVGLGAALELLGYTDMASELRKIGELLIGNMDGPNE
jgi:hypothetical protein